ncbi:MAG TPA: L,D-transpeptidase [Elusimicrobiota bacterium]|nr:L,D-transpeptidase [Elusimicrobiota bacterium]
MKRLFRPVDPVWLVLLGLAILSGLHALRGRLTALARVDEVRVGSLRALQGTLHQSIDHAAMLQELKDSDVARFKTGFSDMAASRKTLFEAGLSLQEERRLLDKQLEIMTTYLQISPSLQRVFLFRGDQPLQSYLISYIPLRAFGGAPEALPPSVRIVSKERFAHPDRGASEEIKGNLQWTPPQVGTSVRSNALGEYVIFTNSKLILHGPPVNPEDHEKFPHVCLGLDLEAAKKLYRATFIGTKIVIAPPSSPQ